MNKPWRVWLVFGVLLLIAIAAVAWISVMSLKIERVEAETAARKEYEENIRLALWRLDSFLSPILVEESSHAPFHYRPFYEIDRAYTKMLTQIERGLVRFPSPLLTIESEFTRLHFQFDPDGTLTSPQVPVGNMRDLAEGQYTSHERIVAASERLEALRKLITRDSVVNALPDGQEGQHVAWNAGQVWFGNTDNLMRGVVPGGEEQAAGPNLPVHVVEPQAPSSSSSQQQLRTSKEFDARLRSYSRVAAQQASNLQNDQMACSTIVSPRDVSHAIMNPMWVNGELLLARHVVVGGSSFIQGCWLDWPKLRAALRTEIEQDLLPGAELVPVRERVREEPSHVLAGLPVELLPGPLPAIDDKPLWSVRMPLIIAWGCVGLFAIAVALLLAGAVSLSERRGSFVSAVTHELRTPLTTFQMYTEMLDEGMVRDEGKRKRYLGTLRSEADRLGHMVENVLSFARLENGRADRKLEALPVNALVSKVRDRLENRAEQAGMELVLDSEDGVMDTRVLVDASTADQILLNLVDNACKYAGATSADRRLHLEIAREDRRVVLAVRDHGPGLGSDQKRRLFKPFSKSASEAAHSAPGVGLGLALSRRLARSMGGELSHAAASDGGCRFSFALRVV